MDLLKDDEIASRIRMVGPWEHDAEEKMLIRETVFKDFMEAMGFLNKLAEAAEKLNHHPDMTLCEYNRVIVTTTTHDAGGITDNDIRLAQGFEEILEGCLMDSPVGPDRKLIFATGMIGYSESLSDPSHIKQTLLFAPSLISIQQKAFKRFFIE